MNQEITKRRGRNILNGGEASWDDIRLKRKLFPPGGREEPLNG